MRALRGVVDSKNGPRSRPRFDELRAHEDVVAVQYETPGAAVDYEMVAACAARNDSLGQARMMVGRIEAMPFRSASFDVVLAMGVLEYVESMSAALAEVARVIRPGGLFLATMLNPASPYRFAEWHLYWPLLRVLRAAETAVNMPPARRHGPVETGIRAYRECALCKLLTAAGFEPRDIAGYDVNSLVPPIDSVARRWVRGWQKRPERTISRGRLKCLGTAYMVVADKTSKSIGV